MEGGFRATDVRLRGSFLENLLIPAMTFEWDGEASSAEFSREFFERAADVVARDLLGARLRSTVGGQATEGVIVEVEAYLGPDDAASHAARRIGRTARNAPMFGPGGSAYVYFIYGMHRCMNVVTGPEGEAAAVLVRALEPTHGLDVMAARRNGHAELTSGPGRLGEALALTTDLCGEDLRSPPLELLGGWRVRDEDVGISARIGISRAVDWPLRFFVRGNRWVSRRSNATG
jgi:DNA-3-methyladenine glycosylase